MAVKPGAAPRIEARELRFGLKTLPKRMLELSKTVAARVARGEPPPHFRLSEFVRTLDKTANAYTALHEFPHVRDALFAQAKLTEQPSPAEMRDALREMAEEVDRMPADERTEIESTFQRQFQGKIKEAIAQAKANAAASFKPENAKKLVSAMAQDLNIQMSDAKAGKILRDLEKSGRRSLPMAQNLEKHADSMGLIELANASADTLADTLAMLKGLRQKHTLPS